MRRNNPFKGAGVALITPFLPDGTIDFTALRHLLEIQLESQTDFLCILGTTAETPCLNTEEKREIIQCAKSIINNKKPLLLGCGTNNTQHIIQYLKEEDLSGIDGLLIVTPYYNKPRQEGLFQHYSLIAQNTDLPIVLYNVPGRTGINLEADTVKRLAEKHPNIVAIKEASGKMEQIETIIKQSEDGFDVLCGDDSLAYDMLQKGAKGVISVAGNAIPNEFGNMVHHTLNEQLEAAQTINEQYAEFYKLLMADGNPAGIKAVLYEMQLIQNQLRLPLVPVTNETGVKIQQCLQNIK